MAALTSFRDVLAQRQRDGSLHRVTRDVDPRYELMAVSRVAQKAGNPSLIFDQVRGAAVPVAVNVFNRRAVMAHALGFEDVDLARQLARHQGEGIAPITVSGAPVHELVDVSNFDLTRDLPQIVHSDRDAGAYMSAGICIARDPATGTVNASFNRVQLASPDRVRLRMMPPQHLGQIQATQEAIGAPMPLAIAIGAPPALMLSAASKIPFDYDEYAMAGAWQKTALRVTPARTVDLTVPADAEIIIEGYVQPNLREPEGPFGEFTDGYVEVGPNHVLQVTAITRRRDAIYHAILAGGREDLVLLGAALQGDIYKRVSLIADVHDIGMPGHIFGCVIAVCKTADEQIAAVLDAALSAHPWMKFVVVVDTDVDVHDAEDVLWAIHTRAKPDTGVHLLRNLRGFPRKDVAPVHIGKLGIDATVPLQLASVFRRRRFPPVDLASYFASEC